MRNPFIAGTWVRGENFFGREALLREILEGERDCHWAVGARRIGKTSLLKELEYRCLRATESPFVPLYWDLEGSTDARGLADTLLGSIEDSEPFRRATGIGAEDLEGLQATDMLATVVRRTVRAGWRLLLLIDEAEELLTVAQASSSLLPRLRRVFQKGPDVRTVLTATRRLARLDERTDIATSPFLQGFIPPLYLTPLLPEEARALLQRGGFPADEIETVIERTAAHPFLLQFIASRLFESRDLGSVLDQVAADEMVANFFAIDFQTLDPEERSLLEVVVRQGRSTSAALAAALGRDEEGLAPRIYALRMLGYLVLEAGSYRVPSWFFERWLRRVGTAGSEARP
jgi:hypothetical protein